MGSKGTGVVFAAIAFALFCIAGWALSFSAIEPPAGKIENTAAASSSLLLITEPENGFAPVERLIESASSSIDVVMYEFEDRDLERLLVQEAEKGVAVRVILDNGYFGEGSAANEQAFDYLRGNGVSVHWSPAYFALTHEKALVVDGARALIMTFNFSPQYYASDRDFGILDDDASDAAAMKQAFDADWNGKKTSAQPGDGLVWSPGSRGQILSLIENAQTSLDVYNEEMEDPQTIAALASAAKRGVDVRLDMTASSKWHSAFQTLAEAGAHVRTYAPDAALYIHAKAVIADGKEAFVGSENFSSTSLDQNRELGIVTSGQTIVSSLERTFEHDWEGATPLQ